MASSEGERVARYFGRVGGRVGILLIVLVFCGMGARADVTWGLWKSAAT